MPARRATQYTKAALLITSMLTVMSSATVAPALPQMRDAFMDYPNVDLLVRLVVTLPALFIVIGAPIAGFIVDRYGRKPLLVGSVVVYGIAGTSGYLAESLPFILAGRAVLGLAVAGVMTCVITLVADYFMGVERARFMGLQAAFSGLGATIFMPMGGLLADVNWRMPFLVYGLAFMVFPLIVLVLFEPERVPSSKPRQPRAETPLDQRAPFLLMGFIYFTLLITQVCFYLVPVQLPFYLVDLLNATSTQTGFAIAGLSTCYALGSIIYGRLNPIRFRHVPVMVAAFAVMSVGFLLIQLAQGWAMLAVALSLAGLSLGFIVPNLNLWLAESVPDAIRGRAYGGFTTALFLGQFLAPIFAQPFSNLNGHDYTYGAAALLLLVMTLCLAVGLRYRHQHPHTTQPENPLQLTPT